MKLLPAVAILAFLILPQAARGQGFDQSQLARVTEVEVFVEDNVKDGCLPSPNILKVEAELVLRRSGITVAAETNSWTHGLFVGANGFELPDKSACIANVSVELIRREQLSEGSTGMVLVSTNSSIFAGLKSAFPTQLRGFVNEAATALANEILKARGQ